MEAVGEGVTGFEPGDEVFGETIKGMQWVNGGAYAEFARAHQSAIALKPANVSFEEAAAVPASALIAMQVLGSKLSLPEGHKVLVNGAAGGVGVFAVQLARAFGAVVTGVDGTGKLDFLRTIGTDRVIDYTKEDFTKADERYDLVFDIPGNHPLSACRRVIAPGGKYVLIGHDNYGEGMRRWVGLLPRMFWLMALALFVRELPSVKDLMPDKTASMALLGELLASGKLAPPIDRTFPLDEVPEAIRYLQEGTAMGKVVVTV